MELPRKIKGETEEEEKGLEAGVSQLKANISSYFTWYYASFLTWKHALFVSLNEEEELSYINATCILTSRELWQLLLLLLQLNHSRTNFLRFISHKCADEEEELSPLHYIATTNSHGKRKSVCEKERERETPRFFLVVSFRHFITIHIFNLCCCRICAY